jgi:hypothetical protein
MRIATVKDWDLILAIAHWSYKTNLPKDIQNKAYAEAWKFTDAYGEPGVIPAQGYDWSGFRDSPEDSTRKSANAIRITLAQAGITEFETEKI